MALEAKVLEALNTQVNNELDASHAYLAVAAYFDREGLEGFAAWFRGHAQEEHEHAMRIYDYIYQRDGAVTISGIAAPTTDFDSALAAVQAGYEHEQVVTGQIHELFELARNSKDFATQNMLQWFVEEQVEEEDLFRKMIDNVEATGNNPWYLKQLDEQLSRPSESGSESA